MHLFSGTSCPATTHRLSDTNIPRQCEGEFTTSCSVHKIIGGCNDPEAFAHARQAMKMRVNCQNYKDHEKRDVGSRNLLLELDLGDATSD